MSLTTPVTKAEAPQRKRTGTEVTSNLSGISFHNVLRDSLGSISGDIDTTLEEAAAKFSLPINLIKATAKVKSDLSPEAVFRAGAMGVIQLMPGTARSLRVTGPYDTRQNIMEGVKYLKESPGCLDDINLALTAYNAGPNSVRKYGDIPPYSETQNYAGRVTLYLNGIPIYANKTIKTGVGGKTRRSLLAAGNLSGSYSLPKYQGFSGYGNLYGLYGLYGGDNGSSAVSLVSGSNINQDGGTVTMDKESFVNLIQMLRFQMMVNTRREMGIILTQEEQYQMVLRDCSRCMACTPQGRRLSEARVIYIGGSVSPFFADCGPRDARFRSRVNFYDEQAGLIATVYELVLHRNPSCLDMPEPWTAECRIQDMLEVVQRQKDIRAKIHMEVRCSFIKHGTSYITIEGISTGDMYMTTAQPLNENEAVTFTYRFWTLEHRSEVAALWVKRIGGGRYGYGCRFISLTGGAEVAIHSFAFRKLPERRQERG